MCESVESIEYMDGVLGLVHRRPLLEQPCVPWDGDLPEQSESIHF